MIAATLLLWALAASALVITWRRGDGSHRRGVRQGWTTARRVLPLLLAAFALVGFVEVLVPEQFIQAWIGPESGSSGLVFSAVAGVLMPGGPYVVFPIVAALYEAGAGIGPAVTLVTAWALTALITVGFELPFMGWRFAAVRWGLCLPFPLLAGLLARLFTS